MNQTLLGLLISVLLMTTSAAAAAAAPPTALANGGLVYEVRSGAYASLFDDDALPASTHVVALDAIDGEDRSRQLVPSTEDVAFDHHATLLYDRTQDALNLVWERRGPHETQIRLARLDADGWAEPVTILARPTTTSHRSSLSVSRETSTWRAAGATSPRTDRSIVHLAWIDDTGELRYAPLVFIEGTFGGWNESFPLLDFFDSDTHVPAGTPSAFLQNTFALRAEGGKIQATFVDPRQGHVVVLEINVQPLDLAFFAAEIRLGLAALIDLYQAGAASSIAGPLRSTIIASGDSLGLNESVVTYVADAVDHWADAWVALNPTASFDAFSLAMFDFVNDLTLALFAGANGGQVIELDVDEVTATPTQRFETHVASTHPAPTTGNGLHRIYATADGSRVLIAWHDAANDSVHYVESTDDDAPWSAVSTIHLSESMTPERVERLLEQRAR